MSLDGWCACPLCDALYRRRPLRPGERAVCRRCGATLYSHSWLTPNQLLGLVSGALVIYLLANAWPIVDLHVQGLRNEATLFGSILALWQEGRGPMAGLVFATTELFPLLDLLSTLALLIAATRAAGRAERPRWFAPLLRFVLTLRPWGMVEVFMLGVLVALVKLSHLAHVVPGVALWAFGALTVLLAAILSFDLRSLWEQPAQ